uniref:Uncharacterized protein n=1 Tax=Arion vulgaris TaxID=1028688 RepID=A0A0B7AVK7_9EUPU
MTHWYFVYLGHYCVQLSIDSFKGSKWQFMNQCHLEDFYLKRLTWNYCPGHAGVCDIERADRLAKAATIVGELKMDDSSVTQQSSFGLGH